MGRLDDHKLTLLEAEYRGPLLSFDELTFEERTRVHNDFMGRVRHNGVDDLWAMWVLYVETLHMWGVMCPHPQPFRLYDGFHQSDLPMSFRDSHWFACRLCQASVINR